MTKTLRIGLLVICSLMAASCGLTDYTVTKRSAIDTQIATARAETTTQLNALTAKQVGLLQHTIDELNAQKQSAANYLFKAEITFGMLKTPTRAEMVMGQSVTQTAAYLPPAVPEVQAATLKALQTELDEVKVSTDTLKAQYERELGVVRADAAAKDAALKETTTQLAKVDAERVTVLTNAGKTERDLQAAKDAIQDKDLVHAKQAEAAAKSVQAIKLRFSTITGVLMLLSIAAAIYSPVFKQQLGLAAVVLAVVTAAIWYLEAWMVGVAVGVCLLALAGWAIRNHYIESKTASSVYHAIQSIKDTATDDYDRVIKPKLAEWMTTYTKDGKTVPDQSSIAHVDEVLMKTGAK